jgi:phosphoglycolate phosphatase
MFRSSINYRALPQNPWEQCKFREMNTQSQFTIDTIIFDFDGVLADTARDIATAANYTLKQLGLPEQPLDYVRAAIGSGAEAMLRRLLGESADTYLTQALPIFSQKYNEVYRDETEFYPSVHAGLERLYGSGIRMSIATNKRGPLTLGILEKAGLLNFFPVVIGPEAVQNRKPHPEALLKVLNQLGTAPDRALMVGDTEADIRAGQAAGVRTCGVTYGYGSQQEILEASPDFVIENFTELVEWVLDL